MSQQQQRRNRRGQDEEEANALLLSAQDIPNSPNGAGSKSPRPNASRSFPQRNTGQSHYNTFIEQQPQHAQQSQQQKTGTAAATRTNKPKLPMRTTKISQKLKLFPEDQPWFDDQDAEDVADGVGGDVYTQIAKIPHGMARQEAEMLNKMDRSELSRMTAYCTAR